MTNRLRSALNSLAVRSIARNILVKAIIVISSSFASLRASECSYPIGNLGEHSKFPSYENRPLKVSDLVLGDKISIWLTNQTIIESLSKHGHLEDGHIITGTVSGHRWKDAKGRWKFSLNSEDFGIGLEMTLGDEDLDEQKSLSEVFFPFADRVNKGKLPRHWGKVRYLDDVILVLRDPKSPDKSKTIPHAKIEWESINNDPQDYWQMRTPIEGENYDDEALKFPNRYRTHPINLVFIDIENSGPDL